MLKTILRKKNKGRVCRSNDATRDWKPVEDKRPLGGRPKKRWIDEFDQNKITRNKS